MNDCFADAAEIRLAVCELIRPARHVTVSDSASKNLVIVNPSGGSDNYSPALTPYMTEPMNLVRSRLFEAVVFAGPARSGKTVSLIDGALAYTIVDDPADVMIVQTNQKQAEDFSKTRIARAIAGSPELKCRLSPRAHDDNVKLKFFRSGMSLRFGYPSLGELSGKDVRRVFMTDVDNITGNLSIDEAFGLALKRTQTYMSAGILVAESSPASDYTDSAWTPASAHEAPPADGILSLYNRGDRRRWHWPCPHCKVYFEAKPGLELFRLPPMEQLIERIQVEEVSDLTAQYSEPFCPHCNRKIQASKKKKMNAAGVWVGEGQWVGDDGDLCGTPRLSSTASFWLGGIAAAYQSWTSLVERFFQALKQYAKTGEQSPLKTTQNVDQAMPHVPLNARTQQQSHELKRRSEGGWEKGTVPEGVRFLQACVDVQAGRQPRFVVQVIGYGVEGEKWLVDRYALKSSMRTNPKHAQNPELPPYLPIDPASYPEDWKRLIPKCILRRYPLSDGSGRTLRVRLTLCDSGGKAGVTPNAYRFHRFLEANGMGSVFRLVKGDGARDAPSISESCPDSRNRKDRKSSGAAADVPVLRIGTNKLKDQVHNSLCRQQPGPGYIHFPSWLGNKFYEELTAETRLDDGWENVAGKPNESFDLMTYGEAGYLRLEAHQIDWDAPPPWADVWDRNPDVKFVSEEQLEPEKNTKDSAVRPSAPAPTQWGQAQDQPNPKTGRFFKAIPSNYLQSRSR